MPRRQTPPQSRFSFSVGKASVVDDESLSEALDILNCGEGESVKEALQRAFYIANELRKVNFSRQGRPGNTKHRWLIQELRKIHRVNLAAADDLGEIDPSPRRRGRPALNPIRSSELDFIREAAKAFDYKLPSGWKRQAMYFDHPEFVRGFDHPMKLREAKFDRIVERVRKRRRKSGE